MLVICDRVLPQNKLTISVGRCCVQVCSANEKTSLRHNRKQRYLASLVKVDLEGIWATLHDKFFISWTIYTPTISRVLRRQGSCRYGDYDEDWTTGFNSGPKQRFFFFVTAAPTPDLRLSKSPNQTVRSIVSLRVRRQGSEAVHLPPSIANVINASS